MILHLDMDAFFASVEQMDNPSLRGKPVIVGGGNRGVVATASYEARVFGIHSAMPIATARKLCPHGLFIHGRHQRYSELSARVMEALGDFSPIIQKASIDEAYLDVSGLGHLWPNYQELALAVKGRVARATGGLTCSIGIAPVKFLAKICSDINKPNGVFILMPENVSPFLAKLEVTRLPGVGKRMAASLAGIGVTTVEQLCRLSREFLISRYGKWGAVLHDRAHGIDPRQVHENPPAKSESSENTFDEDIADREILNHALLRHAERVGAALRKQGLAGRTITVKIKFSDFRQITRSKTIQGRINASQAIFETACSILRNTRLPRPVRLIGICVSGFDARPEQLVLPGLNLSDSKNSPGRQTQMEKMRRLDHVGDMLRERFGKDIIRRASIGRCQEQAHHFGE